MFLLALVMKPFAPFIDYHINKEVITSKFCVNKNKPKLKCNGKCYLSKQLKKAADQEKVPFSPFQIQKIEWVVALVPNAGIQTIRIRERSALMSSASKIYSEIDLPPPTPPPPKAA